MDPSISSIASDPGNFEFAFNSSNFSDRVLRIEIVACANKLKKDEECNCVNDSSRLRKRRRDDSSKEKDAECVNCDQTDTDDCVKICRLTAKTIHINSAILASMSSFFYKLFSNGMRETDQKEATLRIRDTEETALMELLSLMYSRKLAISEVPQILDVLKTADKFEVPYCMQYCIQLLRNTQITLESALLCLNLPCSISAVQPLIDLAKQFLVDKYCDISKFQDEVLNLPLAAIETILRSDNLQVESEDVVFNFVLKWSCIHYPKVEERPKILEALLCSLVRFPHMTCSKLDIILQYKGLNQVILKEALEAIRFKAVPPHRQRALASDDVSASHKYIERTYKHRSVRVMEFLSPYPYCVVYFDLKKEDCANLYPGGNVRSQAFHLCGDEFFLSAHCNMDQRTSQCCFGLFLNIRKHTVKFNVLLEISVRIKPLGDFIRKYTESCQFMFTARPLGSRNLFAMDWDSFMADGCPYFVSDVLHLRAEFSKLGGFIAAT